MTKFKKILAMSAIFSAFTFLGNAGVAAAAASCPHQNGYYERPISMTNPWRTKHTVVYAFGKEEECIITYQGVTLGVYCIDCGACIMSNNTTIIYHSNSDCSQKN